MTKPADGHPASYPVDTLLLVVSDTVSDEGGKGFIGSLLRVVPPPGLPRPEDSSTSGIWTVVVVPGDGLLDYDEDDDSPLYFHPHEVIEATLAMTRYTET